MNRRILSGGDSRSLAGLEEFERHGDGVGWFVGWYGGGRVVKGEVGFVDVSPGYV